MQKNIIIINIINITNLIIEFVMNKNDQKNLLIKKSLELA